MIQERSTPLRDAIDRSMELLIAPSFARSGCLLRSRLYRWPEISAPLPGAHVVVAGATSGIGLASAHRYARLGAHLHLIGRDATRAAHAREELLKDGASAVEISLVNLAERDEVTALASHLCGAIPRLHALVYSAGILRHDYAINSSGTEETIATHLLAPYLLANGLSELLAQSKGGSFILVSSGGAYTQRLDLAMLEMTRESYNGTIAYARAKRAQITLAPAIEHRLGGTGARVYAMHPGWVDTPGLTRGLPRFARLLRPLLRTPSEGAETILWLSEVYTEQVRPGTPATTGLFLDHRERPSERRGREEDPALQEQLLGWCARQTGVTFDE